MSNRYLIINADDFGLCLESNDAVEHLFNEGRITSTTVMTPCPWASDAIARAKTNNKIRMGLHITLNSDFVQERWKSVAPPASVASLLDAEGNLYSDLKEFYDRAEAWDVAAEINAQYNFAANSGCRPTHADSHCGTLYGLTGKPFIKEAYELCIKYGLPFRLPKSKDFLIQRFRGNVPAGINKLHDEAVYYAEKAGIGLICNMVTNPFKAREIKSYENLKSFYLNVVRNLKEGITELFLHPSKESLRFMSYTEEWQKRIWEYRLLLDEDMMRAISQEGIELVGWDTAPFERF